MTTGVQDMQLLELVHVQSLHLCDISTMKWKELLVVSCYEQLPDECYFSFVCTNITIHQKRFVQESKVKDDLMFNPTVLTKEASYAGTGNPAWRT
jgi:hypothetical protein